jgi:CubicO group peptidase (beta-lactamase class C family)
MALRALAFLFSVLVLPPLVGPVEARWDAATQSEAFTLVERFLRPSGLPQKATALSIAIGVDGRLAWSAGIGEEAPGRPATADTVYRIGSITKQFTAAAILRLTERGAVSRWSGRRLKLSSEIGEFIEGVENWSIAGQAPITVRSLLNMTSNLPNYTRRPPPGLDPWGTVTPGDLMTALKRFRPSGWPGSFEYSNTSYFILSEIAGEVLTQDTNTPRSLHDFLIDDVFRAADLSDTSFTGDARLERRLPIARYEKKPVFSAPDWLRGSADMLSTANDLYRWNAALLRERIIGAPFLTEMFKEGGRVTPTTFYAMGWFVEPKTGWSHYSHTGSVAGYTSCNAISRSDDGKRWHSVTLLSNSDGVEGIEQLADDLLALIERP